MKNKGIPNTFIIGVQKSGTTTLHDWLIQHPEIYGKREIKDVDFFSHPERSKNSKELLFNAFKNNKGEKVMLHSCVNYFLYEKALERISQLVPDAKIIVIFRNPVKRAISAFNYFKKLKVEDRDIEEALIYNPKDILEFSRFNNDFTYIEHGLYFKQLQQCLKYFKKEQVLLLEFDELHNNPENLLRRVYEFLKISKNFLPDLKARNVTGKVKNKWIQDLLLHTGGGKKMAMKILNLIGISPIKRKSIKQKLIDVNTTNENTTSKRGENKKKDATTRVILEKLTENFIEDTKQLDVLLGTNYELKWFKKT